MLLRVIPRLWFHLFAHHLSVFLCPIVRRLIVGNIVVSGIAERPHGTSQVVHTRSDFDTISSQLTSLTGDEGFFASIRDCRCLGKYSQSSSCPRPILVTLNSTIAVSSVLSLCSRLTSPISIHPDLTPAYCLS